MLLKKHHINFLKNFPVFIKYKINFYLINLFKEKYSSFFIKNYCKEMKINVDQDFLNLAISDLSTNNRQYFDKKKYNNYLYYDFSNEYLEQINLAWNLDKKKYVNFFEKNFGKMVRNIYHNYNYRIEHVFLYETKNSKSKETYNMNSNFHYDNDFPGALKIIVYLCDVDDTNGPFVYKKGEEEVIVKGQKGTSIIFQQKKCLHAASNTVLKKRVAISFLIYPTLRSKLTYLDNKPVNVFCLKNPFSKYV